MGYEVVASPDAEIRLYHGSDRIVERPAHGTGMPSNDYGLGFYMSPYFEMAAEWAVPQDDLDGYVNAYTLDTRGLRQLDMDKEPFEHWISVLIQNRGGRFSDAINEGMKAFVKLFPFSVEGYDMIKGWRADDAYFGFVRDFFVSALSLENLRTAMKLGDLGTQYCILSRKAFTALEFVPPAERVLAGRYHSLRRARDDSARTAYRTMPNKRRGTLLLDMIGRD